MKESSLLRKLGVFLAIIICSYLVLSIFMDSNGEIHLLGYSFNLEGDKPVSDLLKESDEMMYKEKDKYYQESGLRNREQ